MTPRRVANLIRRAGEFWVLLQSDGSEAARFSGVLPTGKTTLSIPADVVLSAGDILSRVRGPRALWIVTDTASNKVYSTVTLAKINVYADVSRFVDGPRDSFGRVAESEPNIIATKVPLHRYPATDASNATSKDRSAVDTGYHFVTSSTTDIRSKDHLLFGNLSLVVTSLLLSVDGLQEFTATATT